MRVKLITMKKTVVLALLAGVLAITACRKKRTCECVITETTVTTGMGAGTETEIASEKITIEKQRKKEFITKTDCISTKETNTYNYGPSAEVVSTERKCELK